MSLSVARPTVTAPGGAADGPRRIRIMLIARFDPSPPRLAESFIEVGIAEVGSESVAPTCSGGRLDDGWPPRGGLARGAALGGLPTPPVGRPSSKVSRGPSG